MKLSLQIKANLDHITKFYHNYPDYTFNLKIKCTNCGEVDEKWHGVTESETFPTKTGHSETNYLAKCKFCLREVMLDIVKDSNNAYTSDDEDKFKSIVTFECRGFEPVDFAPGEGWTAINEESGTVFNDIDLSEKEWEDYDDKIKAPVGIYNLEHRFVKVK